MSKSTKQASRPAEPSQYRYRKMQQDRAAAKLSGISIGIEEIRDTVRIPRTLARALDRLAARATIDRKFYNGDGAGKLKMPDGRSLDITKNALYVKAIERLPEVKAELADMARELESEKAI